MNTLFIILAVLLPVILIGYAEYIRYRFEELPSISASSYMLPDGEKWKFWLVLWTIGMLNFTFVLYLGSWAFLSSVGIIFAGVTINHGQKPAKIPHTTGTVLAIAATFVGLIVVHNIWLPAILAIIAIAAILLSSIKNKIWKIEEICIILAAIGYIMMILLI